MTSMKVKVSIVVPVYKVEKYLRQCVESLLTQTLKEIEIILVDDGSPDRCPAIIDEYARRDARIVALHQDNQGYGAAVNHGIAKARGEYIGIVESDDWVEPEMYEQLYERAQEEKADVAKGMFYWYDSTLAPGRQDRLFTDPSGVDLRYAPEGGFRITEWPTLLAFHASIWSAIYRAEWFKKIKLQETAGAAYQDFPLMIEALCRAEKIVVVKRAFVHWRNEPEQEHSTSATGKKALQMIASCRTGVELVQKMGLMPELKEALYIHVLWTNLGFFYNIDGQYRKQYFEELRELLMPVRLDKTFKYTYFRWIDRGFLWLATSKSWLMMSAGLGIMKLRRGLKRKLRRDR